MKFPDLYNCNISVLGLGYVGLPLAIQLSKFCKTENDIKKKIISRNVVGFDINKKRVNELNNFIDKTNEVSSDELKSCPSLSFSSDLKDLIFSDVFILCIPTPINKSNQPDLTMLIEATKTVGNIIKLREKDTSSIIIYESTVYPGATEEICFPLIEKQSSKVLNKDFFGGYSPERINPSDKDHKLNDIVKVTSGSDKEAAIWIDKFYSLIIEAGTFMAKNIKTAEAAKVIENTQRDVNIALINEFAIIFNKLGLDTMDILEAASTKWNFLKFRPGLVGGHCIGVDPYYLSYVSQLMDYYPNLILSGRRMNEYMPEWVAEQTLLKMNKKGILISGSEILILGFSFKENCADFRNTGVIKLINCFKRHRVKVTVVDPIVDKNDVMDCFQINIQRVIPNKKYDGVVGAVAHNLFKELDIHDLDLLKKENTIFVDIKGIFPDELDALRI